MMFQAFGCSKTSDPPDPLLNGKWTLYSVLNVKANQIFIYPDSIPNKETITFNDSTSQLTYSGACNYGFGKFNAFNSKINFPSGISSSKLFCKYFTWDDYLYNNLISASEYAINGNQLIIKSNDHYNLTFVK